MHYQILKINITRTIWQTVSRITNEVLGVKGLKDNSSLCCTLSPTKRKMYGLKRKVGMYVSMKVFSFHLRFLRK